MQCEKCGQRTMLDFAKCPSCGYERPPYWQSKESIEPADKEHVSVPVETEEKYGIARGLASFISFIGWADMIFGSIFLLVVGLGGDPAGAIMMIIGNIFACLVAIATAQILHIFIDTEKNTRKTSIALEQTLFLIKGTTKQNIDAQKETPVLLSPDTLESVKEEGVCANCLHLHRREGLLDDDRCKITKGVLSNINKQTCDQFESSIARRK